MATGTNNIAKIWDFYTDINNNDDLENAKTSLSKKYGVFAATAAPASGWGTGLCPSKEEWLNLNSHMKKGDIVINGTYADNRLVKFTDLLYVPRTAELSISPTTWTSPVAGGSQTVSVSYTNTDYYTVTSNKTWCTPPSGNQTATSVTITTTSNKTTSYREATVTFSCVGRDGITVSKTLTVKQYGKTAISVNPTSLTFTPAGGKLTSTASPVNLSSYSVVSGATWCTVSKSNNTISVSATVNSGDERNTTVYVHGKGDYDLQNVTASIAISQSSGVSNISITSDANYTPAAQSNKTATVSRTNLSTYEVTRGGDSWITVSQNGDTVTYSLEANDGTARTGTITVYGTGTYDNTKRTSSIYVSQSSGTPVISTNLTSLSYTEDGGEKNVTVNLTNITSSNYTASSNQTWCTVIKSGTTLTIKCKKTTSSSTRTATVTLNGTGTYGGSDSCTISISQAGGAPSLSVSPTSWDMTSNAAASKSFTVTTSNVGAFNVGSLASWLTVSATSSTSFTLQATKNNGSDRSDTIYVSALGSYTNAGVTASVTISQEGSSSLSVSPITHNMTPAAASGSSTVTANNMTNWYVSATSSNKWLTASKGSGKVNFSVSKNTGAERKGTIFVYGTGDSDRIASTATITINQESGQSSLSISSDADYTPAAASGSATVTRTNISTYGVTRGSASWLTVTKSGDTVNYSMKSNTGTARTATITVYGTGTYDNTKRTSSIYVSQASGKPSISVNPSSITNAGATATNTNITVTPTNISTWQATSNVTWAIPTKSDNSLNIALSANTGTVRSGKVFVHGSGDYGGSATATIPVSQVQGTSSISVSPDRYEFNPAGESKTVTITLTNMDSYSVETSLDWITTSKNGNNVTLTADPNNTSYSRAGYVYFKGTGNIDGEARKAYIYVTQGSNSITVKIDGSSSVTERDIPPSGGGTLEYPITLTNVTTSYVTASVNWLTPEINNEYLYIDIGVNRSSARSGYVYLVGSNSSTNATASVFVSQNSGVSSISISPTSVTAPVAGTSYKIPVTLTNASTYMISESYDWIETLKSGNTATITVAQNTSSSSRTATVSFYTTGTYDNTKRSVNFNIQQPAATVSISPDSLNFDYDGGSQTCTVSGGTINGATTAESSWISYTYNSNSITITVTANSTTLARTGTLHVDINGQVKTVSIYQSSSSGNPGGSGGTSSIGVELGGWVSVQTPRSGYNAYQSNTNHNKNSSVDTCRVVVYGKIGNLIIYINNHSEAKYDYTVAGKLDTDLPTTWNQVTTKVGQGSSKGRTAGLANSLSSWTAVTYTITDKEPHYIDVAYRKNGVDYGGYDRGYLLVPSSW